jgi:hypothetical protein
MYERIKVELKGVHQALYLSRAVSTASSSSEGIELGDEPPNYVDYQMRQRLAFIKFRKRKSMPQRP